MDLLYEVVVYIKKALIFKYWIVIIYGKVKLSRLYPSIWQEKHKSAEKHRDETRDWHEGGWGAVAFWVLVSTSQIKSLNTHCVCCVNLPGTSNDSAICPYNVDILVEESHITCIIGLKSSNEWSCEVLLDWRTWSSYESWELCNFFYILNGVWKDVSCIVGIEVSAGESISAQVLISIGAENHVSIVHFSCVKANS